MQEEVENKTLTLAISTTKMTGRVLKWAVSKYLAHKKQRKAENARDAPVTYKGRQTLKELKAKEPNLANIETALLQAIILMLHQEAPEYEQNFSMVMRVLEYAERPCSQVLRFLQGA